MRQKRFFCATAPSLKNNRPLVEQTIQALRAAGKPAYDPYHEPRISKAGRKPQNQRAQELDQALVELGASLQRVSGLDTFQFLQQLTALASKAAR